MGIGSAVGPDQGLQIVDLITTIGLSGVFIYLYLDERKERRTVQAQVTQLIERMISAMKDTSQTLEKVQDAMRREVETWGRSIDMQKLERHVEELVRERRPKEGG